MLTVTIARYPSTDSGTFGTLSVEGNDFTCVSLELPWKDDQPNISCIPLGNYSCSWRWSQSHGRDIYHVDGVSGRTNVEIHSANAIFELLGCICLGQEQCIFPPGTWPNIDVPVKGIQHSKQTVAAFEELMQQQPFNLLITTLNE